MKEYNFRLDIGLAQMNVNCFHEKKQRVELEAYKRTVIQVSLKEKSSGRRTKGTD